MRERHLDIVIRDNRSGKYLCYNSFNENHWFFGPKHLSEKFGFKDDRISKLLEEFPSTHVAYVLGVEGEATVTETRE